MNAIFSSVIGFVIHLGGQLQAIRFLVALEHKAMLEFIILDMFLCLIHHRA